jgi:hypothetical protein
LERRLLFVKPAVDSKSEGGSLMHSIILWPILTFVAGAVVFSATVEDSANRSFFYWLILPPLVVGALAAFSRLAFS